MWTIDDGVLNKRDVALFYNELGNLKRGFNNYQTTVYGDYIFEIENKLIYTDGNYEYPEISKVITFNTKYENEMIFAKELIYDAEENQSSLEVATSIIESIKGQGFVTISDIGSSKANARQNGNRKRKDSRGNSQNNGIKFDLQETDNPQIVNSADDFIITYDS